MSPPEVVRVRLVFLGAAGVGKTALIRSFLGEPFEGRHRRTVEELHVLELPLDPGRRLLRLELLDTSGSFSFPAMRRLSIARGDGFALVFAPDDPASLEEALRLRKEVLEARPAAPLLLVANKSDVAARPPDGKPHTLPRDLRLLHVSAKRGTNVDRLFQELLGGPSWSGDPLGLSPALRRRSDAPPAEQPRRRPQHKSPSCVVC